MNSTLDWFSISGTLLGASTAFFAVVVTLAALIPALIDFQSDRQTGVEVRRTRDAIASFVQQLRSVSLICGTSVALAIVGLFWPSKLVILACAALIITATLLLVLLIISLYSNIFSSHS